MSRTKAMFCTFLVTIFTMSLVRIIAQIPVVAILDIVCGAVIGCVAVFGIAIILMCCMKRRGKNEQIQGKLDSNN